MFRETHHWTLSSVDEFTLQRRFNASGTWSYATGCVVAAKLKNCSALQTSLTAHPSTHHHVREDWIPSSITVITSNLPLCTHSFTMQHSVQTYPSTYASVSEEVSFLQVYLPVFCMNFLSFICMLHGIHIAFSLIWLNGTLLMKWYSVKTAAALPAHIFLGQKWLTSNTHHVT